MRKLETIQTQEKLNDVYAVDDVGNGGANHRYIISNTHGEMVRTIQFQDGARHEENSISGVIDSDLLEIVRDRLKAFQGGAFSSEYNANALYHIEQALIWMNKRVEDRIARNVLGKNEK